MNNHPTVRGLMDNPRGVREAFVNRTYIGKSYAARSPGRSAVRARRGLRPAEGAGAGGAVGAACGIDARRARATSFLQPPLTIR